MRDVAQDSRGLQKSFVAFVLDVRMFSAPLLFLDVRHACRLRGACNENTSDSSWRLHWL
jgi:hypothetical protein